VKHPGMNSLTEGIRLFAEEKRETEIPEET